MVGTWNRAARQLSYVGAPSVLGTAEGGEARVNMETGPAKSYGDGGRKLEQLAGDGVKFVTESQITRRDENVES